MGLVCPNRKCGKPIPRTERGTFPAKCPSCATRLFEDASERPPAANKTPGGQGKPAKSAAGAGEAPRERVVRSFSEAPPKAPVAKSVAKVDDDPFGIAEVNRSQASDPFGIAEVQSGGLGTRDSAAMVTPAPLSSRAYANSGSRSIVPWIVAGVFGAGALTFGAYVLKNLPAKEKVVENTENTPIFQNLNRNYSFRPPTTNWVMDEDVKKSEKLDIALRHKELEAWILVLSGEATSEVPTPTQLADRLADQWRAELTSPSEIPQEETTFVGAPAVNLAVSGNLGATPIRQQAVVFFYEGFWYRLIFRTSAVNYDRLAKEFDAAKKGFQTLGTRPAWRSKLTKVDVVIASKKYPYQLRVPAVGWRESPDMTVDSRFADVRIIDQEKLATVVVSPRETTDALALEKSYIDRQKSVHEGRISVTQGNEELEVNGRPSRRVQLTLDTMEREFMVVTFVKGEKAVYQIECRAPQDKSATYRPLFEKIVGSFQILAKVPGAEPEKPASPEAKPSAPIAKAKPDGADDAKKPAASETPSKDGDKGVAEAKPKKAPVMEEDVDPAEVGKMAKKSEAKAPAKPTAKSTRKSLDDLDADDPPAKKPADAKSKKKTEDEPAMEDEKPKTEKPAKEEEKPKDAKPASKTKRKSLDDLD